MKQTTKNMRFYGRKNKTAKDLYPYPAKWRSIASQSIAVPMRKPGRGGCLIAAASRFFFYNVGIHADFRRGKIWWQRIYTCKSEIYLQPAVSRKLHKSVSHTIYLPTSI